MSELPPNWKENTIVQLLKDGSLFCDGDWVESKDQDTEGLTRLIQLADIGDGRFLDKSDRFMNDRQFTRLKCTALVEGDILIARMPDPIGRACLFTHRNERCVTVVDVAILRNADADPYWLMTVINSSVFRRKIEASSSGTTRTRISRGFLAGLTLPVPPLAVQQKIAAIFTSIDTAIEKTESLIAKYQKIKAGLMHDLFTRGVTADGKLRPPRKQAPELYQETPIGWIPMDWQCEQLQIVLSKSGGYLQTGPFGSQLHADEYTSEGTPVVMPQDINNEMIELNSIARIPEQRANMLSRHRLKVGDITIARRGDLSRAAAVSEREANWICGTGCFLLRLGRTDLNHFFFSHAYRYDSIQRQIAGIAVGSTMPSLNNSVMSKLFFPVPMPSEQEAISQRLDAMACKITSEQNKLEKLKKQKAGLMQDLLTGKVPVKIDEPDQEFA